MTDRRGMLDGKVALVTGGAEGIGRAAAELFAREGARVVVADLADSPAGEVVEQIGRSGEARFVPTDVSDPAQVADLVRAAVDEFGRLDCAFNNAGIQGPHDLLHEIPAATWDRQVAVNLGGIWHCMRAEVTQMLAQGGGTIVNTASDAGLAARVRHAAYVAVKHGVVGLTRAAAVDYADQGIRVNAVCPGGTRTGMVERYLAMLDEPEEEALRRLSFDIPMGRMGEPREPAEAALWLLSDRSSYVTGQVILIDGGRMTY